MSYLGRFFTKTYFYTLPFAILFILIPFIFMDLNFVYKLEEIEIKLFCGAVAVLGWLAGTVSGHVNTIASIIEVNNESEE